MTLCLDDVIGFQAAAQYTAILPRTKPLKLFEIRCFMRTLHEFYRVL